MQRLDVHRTLVAGVTALAALLLIAAGAEGTVPGAGQHHHAHGSIPPGVLERLRQFPDRPGPEGVPDLRPVDGDPGDAVPLLVEHIGEGHECAPPFRGEMATDV